MRRRPHHSLGGRCGGAALPWCASLFLLLAPVRGEIPEDFRDKLNTTFGPDLLVRFVECEAEAAPVCQPTTLSWMKTIAARTYKLWEHLDKCPTGCALQKSDCDAFRSSALAEAQSLQTLCEQTPFGWHSKCTLLLRDLEAKVNSDRFEVGVLCSIASATTRAALPDCGTLARASVANHQTINGSGCEKWDKATCVNHFCGLYEQFWWRMNASNLQKGQDHALPNGEGILPGCEPLSASGAFGYDSEANMEQCSQRIDISGICDCMCGAFTKLAPGFPGFQCPLFLDAFTMYGRLGAVGAEVPEECELDYCDMLGQHYKQPQCQMLDLPSGAQCLALSLSHQHFRPDYCPWLENHSGVDGVLQCMDGTFCDVHAEGWTCCEKHMGRAKCPKDLPVMCNELCSGETEYCCGTTCEPRVCPVILRADAADYLYTTVTVTTITTSVPGATEDDGFSINIQWSDSFLLWLLLVCPCYCLCVYACWNSCRMRKETMQARNAIAPADMKNEADKDGAFNIVRPIQHTGYGDDGLPNSVSKEDKRIVEKIFVHELPMGRPLGLELEECEVVRVYAAGAKYGWQVGDIILEVADHKVKSFEKIYRIILDEKRKPPVKFLVSREASKASALLRQTLAGAPPPAKDGTIRQARRQSAVVEPGDEEDALRAAAMAPGATIPHAFLQPPSSEGSSSAGEGVALEDVNDDVPPELATRFSPWAMEVAAGVKPQQARRAEEDQRKRDGAEFNVRTLTAMEAETRATRERVKMAREQATQIRKMMTTKGDFQSQRKPKTEVRVTRDAWGRATLHVQD